MAISKGHLEEPLLSQQEQAALRVCLHTTILAEGLNQLSKLRETTLPTVNTTDPAKSISVSVKKLEQFIQHRIATVLTSYTAPSLPDLNNKESK